MLKLSFPTRKLKNSLIKVTYKYKNFEDENLQVYGVTNKNGIVITGKDISDDTSNYTVVSGKTFVYNPYRINVGSIGLADDSFKGIVSPAYIVFKVKNDIHPEFLLLYLKSSLGINLIKWYGNRGGVRSALRFNDLEKIDFPDLSYQQQEEALKDINKFIKIQNDLKQEIKNQAKYISKLRQAILQDAIQGKLVSQNPNDEPASELLKRIKAEKEDLIKDKKLKRDKKDYQILKHDNGKYYEKIGNVLKNITEQIPYSIPYNWQWVKIRNISFVTKLAGFEYTKYMRLTDKGDVPVIRAQNVKSAKLDLTNLKYINSDTSTLLERSSLNKECLLMTFIGAGIGDIAIFNMNKRFHLAPNVAKIEIYNKYENIDNKYIMYYLLSKTGKKEIFKFLKATAQPSLSMDTIREIYVPIPPLAEQKRIVAKVDELMKIYEELEKENNIVQKLSSELFQSVMQKCFAPKASSNKIIDLKLKRAILSAKIINELYEEKYFGAVKLEKILYLCETHLGVTLDGKYKKEAAGPYDAQSRYEIEGILKNKKWFDVNKEQKGNIEVTKYTPLEKNNEITDIFSKVFSTEAIEINNLLELFRGKNSDFCEAIATLYAVWKNRLNNNLSCTDTELISNFKNWSKNKERFYDSDLLDRILFMRRKGLTPDSNIKK